MRRYAGQLQDTHERRTNKQKKKGSEVSLESRLPPSVWVRVRALPLD
jgi:hypothetical protein